MADSLSGHSTAFKGIRIAPNADLATKINGATEKDIVHSGLSFTMKRAGGRIMEMSDVSLWTI